MIRRNIRKLLLKIVQKIFLPRQYQYAADVHLHSQSPMAVYDIIECFSRLTKDVYFIQIGSNDGVSGDPLHDFVIRMGWVGIVVEPVKYLFEKLVENYKKYNSHLHFENAAISEEEGVNVLFRLKRDIDVLPNWAERLGTLDIEVIQKHSKKIPDIDKYIVQEQVRCITFETLIRKHNVKRIDLLHIDTEGHDAVILRQVDFSRFQPKLVIFEHKHLREKDRRMVTRQLNIQGYKLIQAINDTIAILDRNSFFDQINEQLLKR